MKKIQLFVLAVCAFTFSANAQELPEASPYAEVKQRIGLTDVTVEYSRPGVKGREIYGGLLPYGKVWRTGANAPTQLVTSTEVTINGETLPAGRYSIFTVPNEGEWKFMINSNAKASEGQYNEDEDLISIMVEPETLDKEVESLTFWFANVKNDQADLMMAWDNKSISIPIEVEYDEIAVRNIEEALAGDDANFGTYNASARYYLNNGKDLDQALEWSKKSVELKPVFYNIYTLSLIHHARGEYDEAIEAANRSMEMAEELRYQAYVDMNKANIEKWKKEKGK